MKRKSKVLIIIFLSVILATVVYAYFGGFGTGPCSDVREFVKYVSGIDAITVPDGTEVVALGEATHGNSEFQKLKLSVFKILVENYGVRAFCLEADFGGCEAVNRYIHGGGGTAEEAAAEIGFAIYRTDEMAELIEWMRSYNEKAEEGSDLRFYGFDMQRCENNFNFLKEDAEKAGLDITELSKLWDSETGDFSPDYSREDRLNVYDEIKSALEGKDDDNSARAVHFCDILTQNSALAAGIESGGNYNAIRDGFMAENVRWILDSEQKRGIGCIFVSAHNGHVEKNGSYSGTAPVMGALLKDGLGDGYYVIGTDFYRTECNLPLQSGKRITHTFFSHDCLAKAAYKCNQKLCWEDGMCFLDFSKVPEDSPLFSDITKFHKVGSLGESYVPVVMDLVPQTYRVHRSPSNIFDSMIFVSHAHPTQIHQ